MPDAFSPQLLFNNASGPWGLLHLGAFLLATGLIVVLFRTERRLVSSTVGWLLLGIRLTSLLAVVLILLQPTWAWVVDQRRLGRIVVAVDVSQSMQSQDLQATASERMRWFSSMGWFKSAAVPQGDQPLLPSATLPPAPEGIDRATWATLNERLSQLSRCEIAVRTLLQGDAPFESQLKRFGNVDFLAFGGQELRTTATDLPEIVATVPTAAVDTETRMENVLRAAAQGEADSPLLAVILLTDGRDSAPDRALTAARSLGQRDIPIFPVVVGSTLRPKDLSILSVDAPLAVYRGDQTRIKIALSTAGYEDERLPVTLERMDVTEPDETREQTITGGEGVAVVEFDLSTDRVEQRRYRISVPVREGETRVDNNSREFNLQIVDDRTHVMLVDSQPRWEFRYLETALTRDPRVELQVVLFDQPSLGILPEPFFPRSWDAVIPQQVAPDEPKGIAPAASPFTGRDLVVLGDVTPQQIPESRWEELERFVAEEGKVLVLQAGRQAMPLGHTSARLRALLPINEPREVVARTIQEALPGSRGWTWRLTPEGDRQTALQLTAEPSGNGDLWNLLPGANWAVTGQPKTGATVWAYGKQGGDDVPVPLIVHQHYGLGQVIWLATDSTWRWRFRSADTFHHRFWGQLARYAATTRLSAGNQFVQFGPLQSRYQVGEAVQFQARWSAALLQKSVNDRSAVAEVYRDEVKVAEIPLRPEDQRPLVSAGTVATLPAGDYVVRLSAPQLELGPKPLESPLTIAGSVTPELAELSASTRLLEEMASASKGKLFYPDELEQIPQHLKPYEAITSLPQQQSLWDKWPILLLLMGLLTAEWVIRRSSGLP